MFSDEMFHRLSDYFSCTKNSQGVLGMHGATIMRWILFPPLFFLLLFLTQTNKLWVHSSSFFTSFSSSVRIICPSTVLLFCHFYRQNLCTFCFHSSIGVGDGSAKLISVFWGTREGSVYVGGMDAREAPVVCCWVGSERAAFSSIALRKLALRCSRLKWNGRVYLGCCGMMMMMITKTGPSRRRRPPFSNADRQCDGHVSCHVSSLLFS